MTATPTATKHHTLARHLTLLALIPARPRKQTARQLHERLRNAGYKITLRSVERDLHKLQEQQPLECDDGRPAGWWWGAQTQKISFPRMDPTTALGYVMLQRYLDPLLPRGIAGAIAEEAATAHAVLDALKDQPLTRWSKMIAVLPQQQALLPPKVAGGVVEVVYDALLHGTRCQVSYRKPQATRASSYPLNPLGLVLHGGVLYLVATARDYPDPRIYAMHRITRAAPLDEPASAPPGFDLNEYVHQQHQFDLPRGGDIRLDLRVSEWLANHLDERRLAANQRITDAPKTAGDGSERPNRVRATVADTDQLRWWLRSFGPAVEVCKPVALRRELGAEFEALARTYAATASSSCRP